MPSIWITMGSYTTKESVFSAVVKCLQILGQKRDLINLINLITISLPREEEEEEEDTTQEDYLYFLCMHECLTCLYVCACLISTEARRGVRWQCSHPAWKKHSHSVLVLLSTFFINKLQQRRKKAGNRGGCRKPSTLG